MSDLNIFAVETQRQVTVFLDTNVILQYQNGKLKELFEKFALSRFRYVINSVVLQEIILSYNKKDKNSDLSKITEYTTVIPLDSEKTNEFIDHAKKIRNRFVHSNDLLILGSAADCDYLVTDDKNLLSNWNSNRPKIISSNDLQEMLKSLQP